MTNKTSSRQQMLTDAANHLQAAMDLLDGAGAPGHIAAHVDLALHQLGELLPLSRSESRLTISDDPFAV
jgi:hypothetical protein